MDGVQLARAVSMERAVRAASSAQRLGSQCHRVHKSLYHYISSLYIKESPVKGSFIGSQLCISLPPAS